MSKAILVVDLPSNWKVEDTETLKVYLGNAKEKQEIAYYDLSVKELPQFKKPKDPDETWDEMHIRAGYNACLEELLGGNDES